MFLLHVILILLLLLNGAITADFTKFDSDGRYTAREETT